MVLNRRGGFIYSSEDNLGIGGARRRRGWRVRRGCAIQERRRRRCRLYPRRVDLMTEMLLDCRHGPGC